MRKLTRTVALRTLASALVTTLSLAGMLWLVFEARLLDNAVIRHNTFTEIASGFTLLITVLFGSGALWGLGLALVFGEKPKCVVISASFNWGLAALLAALILEVVNGIHVHLSQGIGTSRHFIFVTAFVITIAIVVAWCTYKLTPIIGKTWNREQAALVSGSLASLAYLLVDRYLFLQGWVLGAPRINGVSIMLTVMLYGLTAAAFVGGGVLGWYVQSPESSPSTV